MSRSISSPDYQYAPTKNIYWEKLHKLPPEMASLARSDHQTEIHRGKWREQFLKSKTLNESAIDIHSASRIPLHVEIGCNAGHVVLEWAKQNQDQLYIGLDWKFKMIYRLVEKALPHQLQNLIAFRANADRLPFMFAPGEIDYLHMFFPDPWPKKSQKKNRTANAAWLKNMAPLLGKTGIFHLKTDHAEYFEFILSEVATLGDTFQVIEMTKDLHANHPDPKQLKIPEVTLFERLFIKDGLPVHSLKLKLI